MSLVKELRNQNYDYIDGPIRNHELLQVWRKLPLDEAERFYEHISHAFESAVNLPTVVNPAMWVNSTVKQEYGLQIGLTVLETLLQSLGLGNLGVNLGIKGKGSLTISYDNAKTRECPTGDIMNYLSTGDFKHTNATLLRQLNRDYLIIISGILEAKDVKIEIKSDVEFDADAKADITNMLAVELDVNFTSDRSLVMRSETGKIIPVAVKAHRIIYDRSSFKDLRLVSDNRFFF